MPEVILNVGDIAPNFSLADSDGMVVTLSELHGNTVVLYFYPRDNTKGCTQQACGFRDVYPKFEAKAIVVLGVSTDTAKSHQKFRDKYALPFPLLVDNEAHVATAYGVYGLKKFMGKEYMGIQRTTFVINPEGIIQHIDRKVKVADHAETLLARLI